MPANRFVRCRPHPAHTLPPHPPAANIAHRSSHTSVTPLPLIDSRHETASSVPIAKLKRHVITSPTAARALSSHAQDVTMSRASATRPATAAAAARTPPSRAYERSHVYRSSEPTLRVLSKAQPSRDDLIDSSHDMSDSYMKRNIKQVGALTSPTPANYRLICLCALMSHSHPPSTHTPSCPRACKQATLTVR
jgi:hypothetical protein